MVTTWTPRQATHVENQSPMTNKGDLATQRWKLLLDKGVDSPKFSKSRQSPTDLQEVRILTFLQNVTEHQIQTLCLLAPAS